MIILPSYFFGSVGYLAYLLQGGADCTIDTFEHFIKRSERNHTTIATANGPLTLTVPVSRANRPLTAMCNVKIDYSTKWQHQIEVAVKSAYHAAPYFDMVADRLFPLLNKKWDNLLDMNLAILNLEAELVGFAPQYSLSKKYIISTDSDIDLRPKGVTDQVKVPQYFQLFSDRYDFLANISALDLIFNYGPDSIELLNSCQLLYR